MLYLHHRHVTKLATNQITVCMLTYVIMTAVLLLTHFNKIIILVSQLLIIIQLYMYENINIAANKL